MSWTFKNTDSFHPTLSLALGLGPTDAPVPSYCQPYVLVRLPPAVFIDPHTFPAHSALTFLNSSLVDFRAVDFSRVELEAAVGWSDPRGDVRRRRASASSAAGHSGGVRRVGDKPGKRRAVKKPGKDTFVVVGQEDEEDERDGGQRRLRATSESKRSDARAPLARERTAVLLALDRDFDQRSQDQNNKDESDEGGDEGDDEEALTGVKRSSSPTSSSSNKEKATIDIPLHVRYLPPRHGSTPPSSSEILDRLLHPSTSGLYDDVTLPVPDVLLACTYSPASPPSPFEAVEPDELLPPPHSHLTLPPHLASLEWFRHRPAPQASSRLTLTLPQGDASLASPVQQLTLALFVVVALYIAASLRSTLNRVRQTQAQWEKVMLGKTK